MKIVQIALEWLFLDHHIIDLRQRRALMTPGNQFIYRLIIAFHQYLYPPIIQVFYPPFEIQLQSFFIRIITEIHALNYT